MARAGRPAPSGAKDQVARLLTLVPYLHSHPEVRLDQTAEAVGSTPEQVVKDLGVLFMCGLPGGYPDDLIDVDLDALEDPEEGGLRLEGVIRISNADYLARPLRLTPTEASALIVALRAMRGTAPDDTREVVDRALAKLEAAAASTPGGTALVEPGADDDSAAVRLRASLEDAVARQRQVRLTYYVPARDEESERVVDPRGVITANGVAYLDAWCHSAEAPRLFRLDRIHEAAVLDSAVETAPEPPRDLSDGLFQRSQETTLVTLELQPPARWVIEYYQVEAVRPVRGRGRASSRARGSGPVQVDMLVADHRWLLRLLMRLAPHAKVVSPPELDQQFRDTAQRTLRQYASDA
jgi:proteasome accessory factor C